MPRADNHEFLVLGYGDSPFLPDCLASLRAQRRSSQIRMVTSTPSARMYQVARDQNVDVVVNPVRACIGRDWNFALANAQRRFVTLAHQDDLYGSTFLERTMALFEHHPRGAICFTGYEQVDDEGLQTRSKISVAKHMLERVIVGRREHIDQRRLQWFLSFGNPLPCSSVTFDMERLKGFRFAEDLASNLDWDAWLRLCQSGMLFLHTSERLIGRRHNTLTETSRLIRSGRRRLEDREMFRRTWMKPFDGALAYLYSAAY